MTIKYSERTLAARIAKIMSEIIREEKLSDVFDEEVDTEIIIPVERRMIKYPDIVIWETGKRKVKPALIMEFKPPEWRGEFIRVVADALFKAHASDCRYIAVYNIRELRSWDLSLPGTLLDQLWYPRDPSNVIAVDIDRSDEFDIRYSDIKLFLKQFLLEFARRYRGEVAAEPSPIDLRFVVRLRDAIEAIYAESVPYIREVASKDPNFKLNLISWFRSQGWVFREPEGYDIIARQAAYLLINKILFYSILRSRREYRRELVKLSEVLSPKMSPEEFKTVLQHRFSRAREVTGDYEIVFEVDFLETIPLPSKIIPSLYDLVKELDERDISAISYEILGNIFQNLIPTQERWRLGQYFTRSDVVDLILGFTIKNPDNIILDPGCGAGTFLVRSYSRLKYLTSKMGIKKTHKDLLKQLYGFDISRFPAHLSVINLARLDLSEKENYPKIAQVDFFKVKPGSELSVKLLSGEEKKIKIPEEFDAVIGNPPFTDKRGLGEAFPKEYIRELDELMQREWGIKPDPGSPIYIYFYLHGSKFLREGGRFGFVTSSAWLEVNYGIKFQKFLLDNARIIAIIEPEQERWFEPYADTLTSITIFEICRSREPRREYFEEIFRNQGYNIDEDLARIFGVELAARNGKGETLLVTIFKGKPKASLVKDKVEALKQIAKMKNIAKYKIIIATCKFDEEVKKEFKDQKDVMLVDSKCMAKMLRDYNKVKFVLLKKRIADIIPPGGSIEAEIKRWKTIDELVNTIEDLNEDFEDTKGRFRVKVVLQKRLRSDIQANRKWTRYLRAYVVKDIFSYITELGLTRKTLVPLSNVADVKPGILTGNDKFFYISLKRRDALKLEDHYLRPVAKQAQDLTRSYARIVIDRSVYNTLRYLILAATDPLSEIKEKAPKTYSYIVKEGMANKYKLKPEDLKPGVILFPKVHYTRHIVFYNMEKILADQAFHKIYPKENIDPELLTAILNSTVIALFKFYFGHLTRGGRALEIQDSELKKMLIPDPRRIPDKLRKEIMDSYKSMIERRVERLEEDVDFEDRKRLDKAILKYIGIENPEEIIEYLYKEVIKRIRNIVERDREHAARRKRAITSTGNTIDAESIADSILKEAYDKIGKKAFPDDYIDKGIPGRIIKVPKSKDVSIGCNLLLGWFVKVGGTIVKVNTAEEAKFITYSIANGRYEILLPEDKQIIKKVIEEHESYLNKLLSVAEELTNTINDVKIREHVLEVIKRKLGLTRKTRRIK